MAKVKIQGNASGTGVLTVTAPNTSTDRTITLPDSTGTLVDSTTAVTKDANGNVGIGVTPKTWDSRKALQIGGNGTLAGSASAGAGGYLQLLQNAYTDGTWKYISTDEAARLRSQDGQWNFDVAVSGSADSAISWATKVTIDTDGLKFGTDTASANALHDYEEGNHSATFFPGNSGSITMGRSSLGYVKIGKVVTITGECDVGSVSSPIGGLRVTLPFAIASHTSERNMSFVTRPGMYHVPHHQDNPPLFIGHAGSSSIEGIKEQDDGAFVDYNPQAGETMWFCFSYFTDS